MDALQKITFQLSLHFGVELFPVRWSDLEYAYDVVLLREDPGSLCNLFRSLGRSASIL